MAITWDMKFNQHLLFIVQKLNIQNELDMTSALKISSCEGDSYNMMKQYHKSGYRVRNMQ